MLVHSWILPHKGECLHSPSGVFSINDYDSTGYIVAGGFLLMYYPIVVAASDKIQR